MAGNLEDLFFLATYIALKHPPRLHHPSSLLLRIIRYGLSSLKVAVTERLGGGLGILRMILLFRLLFGFSPLSFADLQLGPEIVSCYCVGVIAVKCTVDGAFRDAS